jgi:hypothetical protein
VLEQELAREGVAGWLRNPPRKPWALTVPYRSGGAGGEDKGLYPDFLILRNGDGGPPDRPDRSAHDFSQRCLAEGDRPGRVRGQARIRVRANRDGVGRARNGPQARPDPRACACPSEADHYERTAQGTFHNHCELDQHEPPRVIQQLSGCYVKTSKETQREPRDGILGVRNGNEPFRVRRPRTGRRRLPCRDTRP